MITDDPVLYLIEILEVVEHIVFENCVEFVLKACQ